MNPVLRFAEWAVKRSPWWKQQMADLEDARINNEIDRIYMEATLAQARLTAKAEIVDDLRAALEANRG